MPIFTKQKISLHMPHQCTPRLLDCARARHGHPSRLTMSAPARRREIGVAREEEGEVKKDRGREIERNLDGCVPLDPALLSLEPVVTRS